MNQKPLPQKGLKRIWAAFFYSLQGLYHAAFHEAAFRQELFLVVFASVVLLFLPFSFPAKSLLWLATMNILVVELLNSAVEKVVDLCSPDFHMLAKYAKDFGSAAVFISIFIAVVLWTGACWHYCC